MKTIIAILSIATSLICLSHGNNSNFEILHDKNDKGIPKINVLETSNYIYDITLQQIQIGNRIDNNNGADNSKSEVLDILNKLKYYSEIDIITLLDISKDKRETLQSYLSEANDTIEKSDYFISNIESEIQDNISRFEGCSKQKSLSDNAYFQALENQDLITMETSINQSKESDKCVSINRIEANSKQALLNKITFLKNILEEKYNFLYKSQNMITDNFQIIKADTAKELTQITEILSQYQIE